MIALAVVCLVLVAAVVLTMAAVGFSDPVTFSTDIGTFVTRPFWLFVLGVATTLLTLVGLALLRRGTQRKFAQRREMKRLRQVEQSSTGPIPTAGAERQQRADDRPGDRSPSSSVPPPPPPSTQPNDRTSTDPGATDRDATDRGTTDRGDDGRHRGF